MTKKADNKQATSNKQQTNVTITNMQDLFDYINKLAQSNNNIKLQTVTGYVALKYANKTICELHDKKRSIAHITFSNKNNAYKIAMDNNVVTRVVPDSYGWRLNTECLLKADALKVVTQIIDSLIAETFEQFNAKTKKQQKQATKKVA